MSKRWTWNKLLLFQAIEILDLLMQTLAYTDWHIIFISSCFLEFIYSFIFQNLNKNVSMFSFPAHLLFSIIFWDYSHLSVLSIFVEIDYLGLAPWIYFKWVLYHYFLTLDFNSFQYLLYFSILHDGKGRNEKE